MTIITNHIGTVNDYPVGTIFHAKSGGMYWKKVGDGHFVDRDGNPSVVMSSFLSGKLSVPDYPRFKQSCCIKKDSDELRKKIGELGWEPGETDLTIKSDIVCDADSGTYISLDKDEFVIYATEHPETIVCSEHEEELFLALAAMRDDSDYKQWFYSNEPVDLRPGVCVPAGVSSFSLMDVFVDSSYMTRKATVEELISYFRTPAVTAEEIEISHICARYAESFSTPPEFTVGTDVTPEQYTEMSQELRDQLYEQCRQVIDFIRQDYDIVPRKNK